MAGKDIDRLHRLNAGAVVSARLGIPHVAGNPGGVSNYDVWFDDTAGKLAVRAGGVTILVPLASELGGGGLTQEQIEDFMALMIQDNSDLDWTYTDASSALVAVVKPNSITYAQLQDVSAAARILGRASGAGAGDPTELTAAQVRTILGTLDADTLGGLSSAALQTAVINAITNGAGAAYDTLVEIQGFLSADDTADAALVTVVATKPRFLDAAIGSGAPTYDWNHALALAQPGAFIAKCYIASTGVEVEYDVTPKTGALANNVIITDETGTNIPTGMRIFLVATT